MSSSNNPFGSKANALSKKVNDSQFPSTFWLDAINPQRSRKPFLISPVSPKKPLNLLNELIITIFRRKQERRDVGIVGQEEFVENRYSPSQLFAFNIEQELIQHIFEKDHHTKGNTKVSIYLAMFNQESKVVEG